MNPDAIQPASILPSDLPTALAAFPEVRVLSLDCFDTLIWRDSYMPSGIFARLPGTTPMQRVWAEKRARQAAGFGRNCKDVTIAEIYAQIMPNAAPAERDAAIAAELDAEARHCFGFAPAVQLMRNAKAKGLQVVIVSDTYLDPAQLRELIARAAGDEVAGLVDRIFCSSTYGKPKSLGLYAEVLRKLSAKPHEILHIGDNHQADVGGVAPFGVHTLHLQQFSTAAEQRFRNESAISAMFHLRDEADASGQLPHRAALAVAEPLAADPAEAFGLTVMGPVLDGFERWLQAEADALHAERGGTVHWLFLMRDGFLPMKMHEAAGGTNSHAIEISRFTATAASFRRDADPLRYLELELGIRPETLARQLLMPQAEIDRLMGELSPSDASHALLREMRKEPSHRAAVAASRAMGKRLVAHVRAVVDPAPGDTLMLVDLGYNGSVQNRIDDLLQHELGVHVAGRYLLLREQDRPGLDKRGLVGFDHYDPMSLEALSANVALLEQVCTTPMGSVVDYQDDGTPIRKANDIKGNQSETREKIQAGCLRFAGVQRDAVVRADRTQDIALWRKGVVAVLGRIMYLPFGEELAVVERFQHDVNLGTERTVGLFDPAVAERGLRQRGLFYLNSAERMYLPAELRGHGLAPKLTLLAHRRFGLPFSFADFADDSIAVPVIHIQGDSLSQGQVEARPTHDGYYLAAVPIGDCRYSVALQFGAGFEYVQIDSIKAIPVEAFIDERIREEETQFSVATEIEGMQQLTSDLYRSADEGGFIMIHPPERIDDSPMLVAVVFRPIAAWPKAEADAATQNDAHPLGVAA